MLQKRNAKSFVPHELKGKKDEENIDMRLLNFSKWDVGRSN
jgi:hypothetical protein